MNNSVEDFFKSNQKNIENMFSENTEIMKWKNRDVLYSFIGIYQIGIYAFYPSECKKTDYTIRIKDCSEYKYFSTHYLTRMVMEKKQFEVYEELNTVIEESRFIEVINSVGNVMPIWPGGNVDKGTKSYCFDIPDIYFYKYPEWFKALTTIYPNAYLDDVIKSEFSIDTVAFLNRMNRTKFKEFLKHIVKIINTRTEILSKVISE